MPMARPPGFRMRSDLSRFLAADAVEHEVEVAELLREVFGPIVDDDVRTEFAHELCVRAAGGGGDRRAQMVEQGDLDHFDITDYSQ